MRALAAILFATLTVSCGGKTTPVPPAPTPTDWCSAPYFSHAPEVQKPDCATITRLIEDGRSRYAAKVEPRAAQVNPLAIARASMVKPDGYHPDGRPYIRMGDETWAAYYSPMWQVIFLADINALNHEVIHVLDRHFYPTLLRTAGPGYRWEWIDHGLPDDPMRQP